MNKFFYGRLALTNIEKNRKTYVPFILASIGTIAMYYIMHFLARNPGFKSMSGGDSLITMLHLGTGIIAVFSFIFLFYTNSFLIKQRKKEFGLFNILGMEKKHIARVIFLEAFSVGVFSIAVGLVTGMVVSKLMFLLLQNLLNFAVPLPYNISVESVTNTAILFGILFFLCFLNNIRHIHLAKPVELLKGGQVGEREPKTRWLFALIGFGTLGYGYYIALVTESPLAALEKFFLAVLLVMVGTYALFTAGSIAILKLLRKKKNFYYKTENFINVSGMIYRMKQNAVGLANIAILSTMVLITLSTTVSLYVGMEGLLKNRYPKDISVIINNLVEAETESIQAIIQEEAEKQGIQLGNSVQYRFHSFAAVKKGNTFTDSKDAKNLSDFSIVWIMPLEDYNALENKTISLEEDEALLYTYRGDRIKDTVAFIDKTFTIKEELEDLPNIGEASALATNAYFIVLKDEEVIKRVDPEMKELSYYYGVDVNADSEKEIALTYALSKRINDSYDGSVEGLEESRESFYSVYGGLFFLGIFLGFLFLMATVLIIYYKQISEGFDDKKRFEIMQKVGLSKDEIKKSIKSQVLMVFFLPLLTAVIHIAFAFKVITKLLVLFNLTDVGLFALCTGATILIFAAIYAIIYRLTAREYYKIVSQYR